MKKLLLTLFTTVLISLNLGAQSFQWHQSNKDNQKFITDYFWTSQNGKWNVFSWNNFDIKSEGNSIDGLLYVEYKFLKDFYIHPEVRFSGWNKNCYQLGIAYRIPFESLNIYLTPKYSYSEGGIHDFQFSINSGYENSWLYYEGYLDTNWAQSYALYTEQKAYYKLTDVFQVGLNAYIESQRCHFKSQIYFSLRIAL